MNMALNHRHIADMEGEYVKRLRHHLMHGGADHGVFASAHEQHQHMQKISDFPKWDNEELFEDLFFYSTTFGSLQPGQSLPRNILIQTDSKFEWMKSVYFAVLHGETLPTQDTDQKNLTVFLTDSGTGRQLMNEGVFVDAICGNGKHPFILPVTRYFQPNATVTVTLSNVDAAAIYDFCQFVLVGRKIFKGRPGQ